MHSKRAFVRLAIFAVSAAWALSGCVVPEDAGVSLLVSPAEFNFGINTNRIIAEVSRTVSTTRLQPITAVASAPWIIVEDCTEPAERCCSLGPIFPAHIPIRVDRGKMSLGTNHGSVTFFSAGTSAVTVDVFAEDVLEADFEVDQREAAAGTVLRFRDRSNALGNAAPINRRLWDFGDGQTSNEVNPAHLYTEPGVYNVSLTIFAAGGRQETVTKEAFVAIGAPQVTVDFSATPTNVALGQPVTFNDLSSTGGVAVLSRTWNFGDGQTSNDLNPVHTYTATGFKTVSLTLSTAFGTVTETKTDYIVVRASVPPTSRFTISPASPFVNEPVQFTDLSEPGSATNLEYLWNFGDGTTSTERNPVHVYGNVGPITATLTLTTAEGSSTSTLSFDVGYKPPTAEFSADNTNPSVFQFVQFFDLSLPGSSPITAWEWNFGDGTTSTERNPRHRYTAVGIYDVTLTVRTGTPANNTDTEHKTAYIVAVNPPTPAFRFVVQNNITTQGQAVYTINDVNFINQTLPGTETDITYLWDFDGDPATTNDRSTETNPTFRFLTAGTYNVTLTAITPTRSVSTAQQIVVDQAPVPAFTVDNDTPTTATTIRFTNTTTNGVAGSGAKAAVLVERQIWDFGDGVLSFNRNAAHRYLNPGSYSPTLTIFFTHSGTGLPAQRVFTYTPPLVVDLAPAPTADFSIAGASGSACITPGTTLSFIDRSDLSVGRIAQYLWDFGDGTTSTLRNPTHRYTTAGNYTVSLMVTIEQVYAPRDRHTKVVDSAVFVDDGQSTALDQYIATPDPAFNAVQTNVQVVPVTISAGNFSVQTDVSVHTIQLTSQTWRSTADYRVDATGSATWRHNMTMIVPDDVDFSTALLFINGGSNFSGPFDPNSNDPLTQFVLQIAAATSSVLAIVEQVPNEPVTFADETGLRSRTEDEIIAYTFDEFLKSHAAGTPDGTWPLLLPMVKSAVRAMDVVQSYNTAGIFDGQVIQDFVVAGASKRGWTTWLTAAVDSRVKAIAPVVIDVLNMDRQMEHHFRAYGYWAPAIYPYAQEQVFDRLVSNSAAAKALLAIVDPFEYRCRLDMPKFILNSAGDQFFLPDSSQWYLAQLPGENYVNYVPNTSHSLDGSVNITDNASAAQSLLSWYASILSNGTRPQWSWKFERDGAIAIEAATPPSRVVLWRANNPRARDFRLDQGINWTSQQLSSTDPLRYKARIPLPSTGYSAFFVQVQFPNPAVPFGIDLPFTFTTPVRVLPETEDSTNLYPTFAGSRSDIGTGSTAIPFLTLHGSPAEMGQQYGQLMANEINAFIPGFLAAGKAAANLNDAQLDQLWNLLVANADADLPGTPRIVEEINAIAAGAGIAPATLRRANVLLMALPFSGSAAAAVRSATPPGSLFNLFQSNSIHGLPGLGMENFPCIVFYIPGLGGGIPHAIPTWAGLAPAMTGLNIAGLAFSSVELLNQTLPATLTTQSHYAALFREMMYDAVGIRQAYAKAQTANLLPGHRYIVGDGRNLGSAFKEIRDGAFSLIPLNSASDENSSQLVFDAMYSASVQNPDVSNIFNILSNDAGSIDFVTMHDVNAITTGATPALLDVIYNADAGAVIRATYAGRPTISVDLQDFLP